MLRRLAVALAIAAAPAAAAAQQPRVIVRHVAPPPAGGVIADVLAHPYTVRHEQWNTRLFRATTYDSSVVVPGSDATVAGTIHGDVLVVGGNLFLQPTARIDGRAIAVGGRVYDTRNAQVKGGKMSFPAVQIAVDSIREGYAIDYRPPSAPETEALVSLPAVFGFRIPSYDRVEGLSIVWGPHMSLIGDRLQLDPTVTYRSDLGAFDVSTPVDVRLSDDWSITGSAGRSTLTNDAWIEPSLVNSAAALFVGRDYRNYWRSDRFEGLLTRTFGSAAGTFTVAAGARTERDWSVNAGGPWSLTGYASRDGIIRPNPAIEHGRVSSALGRLAANYQFGDARLAGSLLLERPFDTPRDERFTQTTVEAALTLPTVAGQRFILRTHDVLTAGDTAPPQRFAYLGGANTLPTFRVLSLGGDRLVFVRASYVVPIRAIRLKLVGSPTISVHDALGSAGVGHLPRFEQNLGGRLNFSFFWVAYDVDPRTGRDAFSVGLNPP